MGIPSPTYQAEHLALMIRKKYFPNLYKKKKNFTHTHTHTHTHMGSDSCNVHVVDPGLR